MLDPELIVLTGGFAAAGAMWWDAVREGVADQALEVVAATPVVPATAGVSAALLGAAEFARLERARLNPSR